MSAARAMDFFGLQDRARRNTVWLVVLYALAVAGIVAAIYLFVLLLFGAPDPAKSRATLWQPNLLLSVAGAVAGVVGLGTAWKTVQLLRGGEVVARMLGGRRLDPATSDPAERRALNVVEEMALAAGLPVPHVYVLDAEEGINAFAAGFGPRDAVIGLTRGALERLSRDELQGVVAHEFSHILYGDMRLNLRLMGVLHGILLLALIGRTLVRAALRGGRVRRRSDRNNPLPLLLAGAGLWVIGSIGVFVAALIKAAVSRQREFLADAAAAQFTRNPAGLASALRKVAAAGALVQDDHAAEASHLFFCNALGRSWVAWFATHPPLQERIRRLEPGGPTTAVAPSPLPARPPTMAGLAPETAIGLAGTVTPAQLELVQAMLAGLPPELPAAARSPAGARGLIYALALTAGGGDPDTRRRQFEMVAADSAASAAMQALGRHLNAIEPLQRLPLVELAAPALRTLPPSEQEAFVRRLDGILRADRRLDLFEYALAMVVRRQLVAAARPAAAVRHRTASAVRAEIETLIAGVARRGRTEEEEIRRAFETGLARLGWQAKGPPADPAVEEIDAALEQLAEAAHEIRRRILLACGDAAAVDGELTSGEYELIRAISEALDCPMPPLAQAAA